jgi:hypothetical protein
MSWFTKLSIDTPKRYKQNIPLPTLLSIALRFASWMGTCRTVVQAYLGLPFQDVFYEIAII